MSRIITRDLGTIDIGAGGETAPIKVEHQHGWNIAPTVVGTPGTAKYTVRVSDDNITYHNYKTLATGVDIVNPVQDDDINWLWVKVAVVSGGPSAGTAQFTFFLKR